MVDHHIVGFNVAVHDSHTVTVVQSLAHVHVTQNKTNVKALTDGGEQKRAPREHWYLQKFVHIETDVVVGQLLIQLLQPQHTRATSAGRALFN